MECPYCAEDAKDEALVCPHCRRDLFVIKPLLAELDAARRRIAELEAALASPAASGAALSSGALGHAAQSHDDATFPIAAKIDAAAAAAPLWLSWILTYTALVAAHFLIIIWFDLPLIALRLVSILTPVGAGFCHRQPATARLPLVLLAGIALSAAAILTMSAVVAKVDDVPLLPHDQAGWREYLEYGLSIAFGFFTGAFVRHAIVALNEPGDRANRHVRTLSRMVAAKFDKGEIVYTENEIADRRIKRIEAVAMSWLAACSALISVVTGLWPFLNR